MRGPSSIDSLSIVLEGLARRLGLESKLLESRLRRDWSSIVGEPIASNTWPDQIRYKKLYLLVHNSVWLHQLTFLKPTLLHKLITVAGGELITDIVLRVGEIPSRATASAVTPDSDSESTIPEAVQLKHPRLSDTRSRSPSAIYSGDIEKSSGSNSSGTGSVTRPLNRMRVASEISSPFGMGPNPPSSS